MALLPTEGAAAGILIVGTRRVELSKAKCAAPPESNDAPRAAPLMRL